MTNDEEPKPDAQSEQDKSVLEFGVVRIIDQEAVLVHESCLSLLERNAVLSNIGLILSGIPFEAKALHADIIRTS